MLTFNLKKEYYNMIVNGYKRTEYRESTKYWDARLCKIRQNNKIRFALGYTKTHVDAVVTGIDKILYSELPTYAKQCLKNNDAYYYRIQFYLKGEVN